MRGALRASHSVHVPRPVPSLHPPLSEASPPSGPPSEAAPAVSSAASPAAYTAQELRAVLGQFATGVTIITTLGTHGRPVGLTANSFNSVSLVPPLVLWSLSCGSGSAGHFEAASHFAVNVLAAEQRPLAERFASRAQDRFSGVDWRAGTGGVPILEGAAAVFECRARSRYPEGDHVIYVGEVERCARRLGAVPLLFWGGRFFAHQPVG